MAVVCVWVLEKGLRHRIIRDVPEGEIVVNSPHLRRRALTRGDEDLVVA